MAGWGSLALMGSSADALCRVEASLGNQRITCEGKSTRHAKAGDAHSFEFRSSLVS
jgi:hypothetical protein